MTKNIDFLKEVLSVPTQTYKEDLMVEYLTNWLTENNIAFYKDTHNNVYATKQESQELPEDFHFPCVISHTDTVHEICNLNIREEFLPNAQGEEKLSLKAYDNIGLPVGIGGDDKCGVFACLTLLKELPNLKAAFFVSEKTGCHGSNKSDPEFFKNVGYGIQFDAPENWMITEKCFGQILFDRDSEFFEVCDKVLTEGMVKEDMDYMVHPYTDVYALRSKFDFSCINFSIKLHQGYGNYEDFINESKTIEMQGYCLLKTKTDKYKEHFCKI